MIRGRAIVQYVIAIYVNALKYQVPRLWKCKVYSTLVKYINIIQISEVPIMIIIYTYSFYTWYESNTISNGKYRVVGIIPSKKIGSECNGSGALD